MPLPEALRHDPPGTCPTTSMPSFNRAPITSSAPTSRAMEIPGQARANATMPASPPRPARSRTPRGDDLPPERSALSPARDLHHGAAEGPWGQAGTASGATTDARSRATRLTTLEGRDDQRAGPDSDVKGATTGSTFKGMHKGNKDAKGTTPGSTSKCSRDFDKGASAGKKGQGQQPCPHHGDRQIHPQEVRARGN